MNQGQTKRRITFLKRKIDEFQSEMEELQAKMKIDFPEVLQGKIKGKGRPKAKKVEVDEVEADDLFAKLVVANTKNTIATVEASKVRSELYDIEAACDVEKEEACDVEKEEACVVSAVVEVQNNKKKKHVLTEAEKEAKKAALEAEKEAKKAALAAEKEAKKAEKKPVKDKKQKKQEEQEEKPEEPKTVKVCKVTIQGKQYLRDGNNVVYDFDTKEVLGEWNKETDTIMGMFDEEEEEAESEEEEEEYEN